MSVAGIESKCWILALFIRGDGQRLLLGDGAYDFKENQQHFAANDYDNDTVEVQGSDGILLAGQVRRSTKQNFDGYIGDATMTKAQIEQYRRNFFMFFRKNYFYEVVYVFPNGDTIMRQRGFIVDAPEVEELWQIHPEYHVALNFEDVNYYAYAENEQGQVIYSGSAIVPITGATAGGLVWDEYGAVTGGSAVYASGTVFTINNSAQSDVELNLFEMYGESTQNGTPTPSSPVEIKTVTGSNTVTIDGVDVSTQLINLEGKNLFNGVFRQGSISTATGTNRCYSTQNYKVEQGQIYTISTSLDTSVYRYAVNLTSVPTPTSDSNNFQDSGWQTSSAYTFIPTQDGYFNIAMSRIDNGNFTPSDFSSATWQLETTEFPTAESLLTITPQTNSGITATVGSDGSLTYSGTATNTYANISTATAIELPAGTYTFTVDKPMAGVSLRLRLLNSSSTSLGDKIIGVGQSSVVFTIAEAAAQAYVWLGNVTSGTTYNDTIMPKLIAGTLDTTYEGYWGGELNKVGDSQDYIYKSGDDWYVHKAVFHSVLNGSETWRADGGTVGTNYRHNMAVGRDNENLSFPAGTDTRIVMSDRFIANSSDAGAFGGFYVSSNWAVFQDKDQVYDLTTWKAWLAENQPEIFYQLAAPYEVKLTNADLIAQLEGALALSLNPGENDVSTVTDGALPTLRIGYESLSGGGFVWEAGEGIMGDIIVNSVDNVYPVWTVTGETVNPTLENVTTGTLIQYNGTITDEQTLVIDMTNQTATLNGANVIGNVTGDWLMFAPGRNRIVYTADNQNAPASKIEWNDIVG